VEVSWGVTVDGGDSGGVNLGDDGILFSWGIDDEVDGVLLDVNSNGHLTWDTDTEGTDSSDGVGTIESWDVVVDGGCSVDVKLEAHVVVSGQSGTSLIRGDLSVNSGNGGDSADDGNGGSEFIGFLNGGSSDEKHAIEFLVISGILVFSQFLDELGNGGDRLGIGGMVSDNTVVEHDGDFNPEWLSMTFLDTNLGEDFLKIIEINDTGGHTHNPVGKSLSKSLKTDEEGQVVGSISSGLAVESNVEGTWEDGQARLLNGGDGHMSEVVLAIIIVRDILARVLGVDLPVGEHLDSGLGIRSNERTAWLGAESQGTEHGDNEVLDIGILFSPHVEGSFLEERFLLGIVQSPHQSMSPEFRILLTIVEDGEEFVTEGKFVNLEQRLKSTHGGVTDGTVLVLVLDNIHQNPGGSWEVDVLQSDDGFGLFLEVISGIDLVREDLDVFVQKSGL
jgi:hypothetical protein